MKSRSFNMASRFPKAAFVPATFAICLTFGCQVPRAKLANLHELHQPTGQMSYRGNVRNDIAFLMAEAFKNIPVRIAGFDPNNNGPKAAGLIEDPCRMDLENLNALARMSSADIYVSGLQIEAFGWLGVDDQFVLGRERAILELGAAAKRLGLDEPLETPAEPATPEQVSKALVDLARVHLGRVPGNTEDDGLLGDVAVDETIEMSAEHALAQLRSLAVDRQGALRILALCDVLFYQRDGLRLDAAKEAVALREYALEIQSMIVGYGLVAGLDDPAPLVRKAAYMGLASLPGEGPLGLLMLAGTDPDASVASAGLRFIADHGLPLARVPEAEREAARGDWIAFLVGQAQSGESRVGASACLALSTVVADGPKSMRPEEWSAWWRAEHPDSELPRPLSMGSSAQ